MQTSKQPAEDSRSVESFLTPEEIVWWERFVKKVGFEPGVE